MKTYFVYLACIIMNVMLLFLPGKFKWLNMLAIVFILVIALSNFYLDWQYKWKDNGDGTITSRKYGTYPKKVEFKEGMTIMPGQTAVVGVEFPKEK